MTIRAFKDERMILPNVVALFIYTLTFYLCYEHNDYRLLIVAFFLVNTIVIFPSSIFFIRKTFLDKGLR